MVVQRLAKPSTSNGFRGSIPRLSSIQIEGQIDW